MSADVREITSDSNSTDLHLFYEDDEGFPFIEDRDDARLHDDFDALCRAVLAFATEVKKRDDFPDERYTAAMELQAALTAFSFYEQDD